MGLDLSCCTDFRFWEGGKTVALGGVSSAEAGEGAHPAVKRKGLGVGQAEQEPALNRSSRWCWADTYL